uniref:Uncharacterized protein n=1 Tax=Acrobeloides nanus TaxID=290746 RepID=A0A914DZN9_9BILA
MSMVIQLNSRRSISFDEDSILASKEVSPDNKKLEVKRRSGLKVLTNKDKPNRTRNVIWRQILMDKNDRPMDKSRRLRLLSFGPK